MDRNLTFSVRNDAGVLSPFTQEELQNAENVLGAAQTGQRIYSDSLGWHSVDKWADSLWLARCQKLANLVRRNADALVVIGIGGSNQAARAVIDALGAQKNSPEIMWAGNSISAHSIHEVLEHLTDKKSVYINVIAKNFETLEPGIGFRALRRYLQDTYGSGWEKRVIVTGTEGSQLERLARFHAFHFLPFPKDIGGRFTALSPVALFPIAAAGIDIRSMAQGAKEMEIRLKTDATVDNPALNYAMIRNALYQQGYYMEMLSFFEPRLFRFAKWWMQLFGESEGKDGKGLYPLFGNFSEDLHSVGQFIQDGTKVLFETFLDVRDSGASYVLRDDEVNDGFHYLDGIDFNEINQAACEATVKAHAQRFPCLRISVPAIDGYSFGQLFYFFEFACYISARLLGVDPFDQPGVEAYKVNMFRALGR